MIYKLGNFIDRARIAVDANTLPDVVTVTLCRMLQEFDAGNYRSGVSLHADAYLAHGGDLASDIGCDHHVDAFWSDGERLSREVTA